MPGVEGGAAERTGTKPFDRDQTSPRTKGQRTRARILRVAEEVFGEVGYHNASVQEVTQRAGVALGTFYVHFSSKKAIFEELADTRWAEMRDALVRAVSSVDPRDRRGIEEAAVRTYFGWVSEHPHLHRIQADMEALDPRRVREPYREHVERYAASLRWAMAEGLLPPSDPEVLAWGVIGMMEHLALRFVVWEGCPMPPEKIEAAIELALRVTGAIAGGGAPPGAAR